MPAGFLIGALDMRRRRVFRSKKSQIRLGVSVADRLVGEKTQRLVLANRPTDLLADIRLDQLSAPVAVIRADQRAVGNVVQQTREHDLLIEPEVQSELCALQKMIAGELSESMAKKILQAGFVRHFRQYRIVPHHEYGIRPELRHELELELRFTGAKRRQGGRHDEPPPSALQLIHASLASKRGNTLRA